MCPQQFVDLDLSTLTKGGIRYQKSRDFLWAVNISCGNVILKFKKISHA